LCSAQGVVSLGNPIYPPHKVTACFHAEEEGKL